MRFSTALMMAFVLFLGMCTAEAEAQIKPPSGPVYQPPYYPRPVPPPAPVAPPVVKQRWRVTAKMVYPDRSFRFVYITWYGYKEQIDWSTAAVCEYLSYRFYSPWERMMAYYEIKGPPVLDMTTPIN
jgi:hypothetical protein